MEHDLNAIAKRCCLVIPLVKARKIGAKPKGSIMINNVVNAAIKAGSSVMVSFLSEKFSALIFSQLQRIRIFGLFQAAQAIASRWLQIVQVHP